MYIIYYQFQDAQLYFEDANHLPGKNSAIFTENIFSSMGFEDEAQAEGIYAEIVKNAKTWFHFHLIWIDSRIKNTYQYTPKPKSQRQLEFEASQNKKKG